MKFTVKTVDFQDIVGRASKCVSNNKLIPITSLMNVKVKDNILTLTTTDATNYFYVTYKDKVDCEDFEFSVVADTFIKLIQKTTSEYITVEDVKQFPGLKVVGNGTYTLELPLDENGSIIKFPVKFNLDDFRTFLGSVKLTTIKSIIGFNKPSLATSVELPSLTCYYCGDEVLTSDRFKICCSKIKLLDEPVLITPQFMDLVGSMSSEDITVSEINNSDIIFESAYECVYAPKSEGLETYPAEAILNLVNLDFGSSCKISKSSILNLLDRLSLFVSKYDKNVVRMTFTNEGILFSSKQSSGVELIPYIEVDNFTDFVCFVDIEMLRSQVNSQVDDKLNLYYGSDISIKLVSNNITQVVALAEED